MVLKFLAKDRNGRPREDLIEELMVRVYTAPERRSVADLIVSVFFEI